MSAAARSMMGELHLEAYRFEGIVQPFPVHFHEHYVLGLVERLRKIVGELE